MKLAHPMKGILLAVGGTLGQAAGLVLSKHGLGATMPSPQPRSA